MYIHPRFRFVVNFTRSILRTVRRAYWKRILYSSSDLDRQRKAICKLGELE